MVNKQAPYQSSPSQELPKATHSHQCRRIHPLSSLLCQYRNRPRRSAKSFASRNVASVRVMTTRTRLVFPNPCSLATSADEVVCTPLPFTFDHSLEFVSLGHPSCLQLEDLGDAVRSYPWKCPECKSCEVCEEKDGDVCPGLSALVLCLLIVHS